MASVIYITDRTGSRFARRMRAAGHHVYESFTPDHAVVTCVKHYVDFAVLDQGIFVETDNWSVAQSIKTVRPSIAVALVSDADMRGDSKPTGVDVILGGAAEVLRWITARTGSEKPLRETRGADSHSIQ